MSRVRQKMMLALYALVLLLTANYLFAQPLQGTKQAAPGSTAAPTGTTQTSVEKQVEENKAKILKLLLEDSVKKTDDPQFKPFADAIDQFSKRQVDQARATIKAAVGTIKGLPPVEIFMARLWSIARQMPNMRLELEQCVKNAETTNDPEAYLLFAELGIAERRVTDADLQLERAEKLVAAYNDNPVRKKNLQIRWHTSKATVYEARSQWPEAEAQLRAWIALEDATDKNATPHVRLGNVLFELKDQQSKAWEEKRLAAAYDPNQPSPNAALALMFFAKKDNVQAKKMFDEALKETAAGSSKERRLASNLLAFQWAIAAGDFAYAKKAVDGAMAIDPKSVDANMNSAILSRFNKQYADAEKKLDTLHMENPNNFPIANNLVLVLIEQTDEKKRLRAAELAGVNAKLFGQEKNNPQVAIEAAATYGWVAYKMGKMEEAQKVFQALVSNNALNGDSAYYVAKFMEQRNQLDEAKAFLDQLVASPQVFFYRSEAEELQKIVQQKIAARPQTATPMSGTPQAGSPLTK